MCNATHKLLGHRKRCNETSIDKMCNATDNLSVIQKDGWDFLWKHVQGHSLAIGHRKGCDKTAMQMPLTFYWSWKRYIWWDCLSQSVQYHSLAVGCRERCDGQAAFHKMCTVVTHSLLVIEKTWWDWLSQNVQSHLLAGVGHNRKDVMRLTQMFNVTHFLLVIGNHVMRAHFRKCAMTLTRCWSYENTYVMRLSCTKYAMSLTDCWSQEKMWWDYLYKQNVQCHSQTVGHRKASDDTTLHKMCNTTYWLLVMRKDVMWNCFPEMFNVTYILWVIGKCVRRLHFTKCVMLLTGFNHRKSNETAFHKMCNVTHFLLATGKDVMNYPPFTKCTRSLTFCWWQEKMWWDCLSQNLECHSQAVSHRNRCNDTTFTQCAMSLTCCWS